MPVTKTLTSDHHGCSWIVNMKATLVRVSMSVIVAMTILGCPGIVNMKATLVRVSMSVIVTMTILGCPGIVNMKATLVSTLHSAFMYILMT